MVGSGPTMKYCAAPKSRAARRHLTIARLAGGFALESRELGEDAAYLHRIAVVAGRRGQNGAALLLQLHALVGRQASDLIANTAVATRVVAGIARSTRAARSAGPTRAARTTRLLATQREADLD